MGCSSIDIEPRKLNIKYAINGTGKSTIAKAIQAKVTGNEDGLKQLLPFRYERDADEHQPSISGLEDFHSVQIFNEDYVNQYVYQPDELIKDSFTIFVKTPDYDRNMAEITQLLESISQTFQSHPELDQLIQTLNQFVVGFGKATQRGLSAASPIMKGLGRGNMIHNIPQGLESYAPYLQHTEGAKNVAWIKWQLSGNDYLEMADQCPYCSGSIEKTREKIKRVRNVFHVGDGTREAPMKCIGNGIEIPMTPDEVQKGTEDIKKYILDFDYQMAYQRMEDQNLLISLYDSTEANYEKLQIYRLIFIGRPMNVVVQKFVNETYHVENDYMFQLDPRIYDTVPQYIVDVCNQAINELRTVQPA